MKKLILSLLNIGVQKAKTACRGIISKIDKNHFAFGVMLLFKGKLNKVK